MTLRRSLFALWAALAVLWVGYVLAQPVSYYDDFKALQKYVAERPHDDSADLDDDYTLRQLKDEIYTNIIRHNPGFYLEKARRNDERAVRCGIEIPMALPPVDKPLGHKPARICLLSSSHIVVDCSSFRMGLAKARRGSLAETSRPSTSRFAPALSCRRGALGGVVRLPNFD
jgi:hypothetical protein